MFQARVIIVVLIAFIFLTHNAKPSFAAGELEYTSPPFGAEQINGVTNDVYGLWSKDGKDYWGLRSGNFLEPLNDVQNANATGIGSSYDTIVKNADGDEGYNGKQRVHGSYKTNTNSCASCHLTHTARGSKLLFKTSIWNVCTSCHDGTMGILNVFKLNEDRAKVVDGYVTDAYAFGGGTFAGPVGGGSSMHMATGIMQNKAAPGGYKDSPNIDPSVGLNTDPSLGSTWSSQFSCASCHSPHGSYSDRLLHYNPNGVSNETADLGGLKRVGVDVYEVNYNSEVRYVVPKDGLRADYYEDRDQNPWLYGYSYTIPREYWTKIYAFDASGNIVNPPEGKSWNDVFEINYSDAYFKIPSGVEGLVSQVAYFKMDVAPVVKVKMTLSDTYDGGVRKVVDYGDEVAINRFCVACHTDYIYTQGGIFESKGRHRMDVPVTINMAKGKNGKITCLTCHLAHGSTGKIMLDSENYLIPDSDGDGNLDYVDINKSSVLKRYVNTSACAKCHYGTVMTNQ